MVLVRDLVDYLKAVLFDGTQLVFTFFDILGLVVFFFPSLAQILTIDLVLAQRIGSGIVLVSFVLANFRVYRDLAKHTTVGFDIIEPRPASRPADWLHFNARESGIADEIPVGVAVRVRISNSGSGTSVRFYIRSVKPNCLAGSKAAQDVEIRLKEQISPRHQATDVENPYRLQTDDAKELLLVAEMAFDPHCLEERLGCLADFRQLTVELVAQPTGRAPIARALTCDLGHIHKDNDDRIVSALQHTERSRLPADDIIKAAKRYWGRTEP